MEEGDSQRKRGRDGDIGRVAVTETAFIMEAKNSARISVNINRGVR